jgi:hypothetical protein
MCGVFPDGSRRFAEAPIALAASEACTTILDETLASRAMVAREIVPTSMDFTEL